ncbi:MAG: DNA topoisomerase III [Firmicutes bacterium]|nr:DNA topoisomerase III [Bacillota bacterium]
MGKILVVAEKPSVGRDLARILKSRKKEDGYMDGSDYVVTWAIGHLAKLYDPGDYDQKFKRWSMGNLPLIPPRMKIKVDPKHKKQFDTVKMLMNSTQVASIICATDAGREGELIFRYIYELAGCKKPVERLWISSMVDEAIKKGFQSLRPGNEFDNLFYSARCRSEADWLVGINATRAFTVRLGHLFSVGRVQTPTLALLVQRQEEIDNFVAQDYWEIRAHYPGFSGLWYDYRKKVSRTYDQNRAREIATKVEGKNGIISNVREETKRELPPQLYDLNELQRDANKSFGYPAQKTLDIAQKLYEKYKVITYPRTDSRYLQEEMVPGLKALIENMGAGNPSYRQYADYLLGLPELPITGRIVDNRKVTDHHAIIPTGKTANLPLPDRKIYDLVALRLLAAFYPPHIYKITSITAEIEGEHFVSRGKVVEQEGWKGLHGNISEETGNENESRTDSRSVKDTDREQILPALHEGDPVRVCSTEILQKKTRPPAHYTEATLLSAMENAGRFVDDDELKEHLKERGLGTPATRAGIIERLIAVGYLTREGKKLVPTRKGIGLIGVVPSELKSPEMTGAWEQKLNDIKKGLLKPTEFMVDIKDYTAHVVGEAGRVDAGKIGAWEKDEGENNTGHRASTGRSLGSCPSCKKGEVVANSKGYGCNRWRGGCTFFIGRQILGRRIGIEDVKRLILEGETGLIEGFTSKKGKKFRARLVLEEGGRISFKFT